MNKQQKEAEETDSRSYAYAIVAIILITSLVIVLVNNGRVTDVENLDARVGKIYHVASPYAIQKVFEKKDVQYPAGAGP